MQSRLLTALAAILAAGLLLGTSAQASTTQESIIQDDTDLLERGGEIRDRSLDEMVALGVDVVKVNVIWERVAPAETSRQMPSGFDGADPADYGDGWNAWDDVVRAAHARGLPVLLTPTAPAPRWAIGCSSGTVKQLKVCKPDAAEFEAFVRAMGTRYSGTYNDEDQGGQVLPRVSRWSIWNEPNQPGWLYPQYEKRSGRTLAVAAHRYRDYARRGINALRATGHTRDQILIGETAPLGATGGALGRRAIDPTTFLRELFCIDARGRRYTGTNARVRGCSSFQRLAATGFAHHPYTRGAAASPTTRMPSTWITLLQSSRLSRLLDQAGRAQRIPSRLPIHYTEFGFQTRPEDRLLGVSHSTQASWLNWADFLAYRNPRIRSVSQYKLHDDRTAGGFQTGLKTWPGKRKASYDAYKLPLYVVRSGNRSLVYGQVRPAGPRDSVRVEVQHRTSRSSGWRVLSTRSVRSARGHFTYKTTRRSGQFRLRWVNGSETLFSRTAGVAKR